MKLATMLALTALSLAACQKDPPATTPDSPGGGDPGAGDPYACTEASDCVAVELQCCDACNGGEAVGVHEDHVDAVLAGSPRGQGACNDVACTERGCADWVPTCDDGRCAITRGDL